MSKISSSFMSIKEVEDILDGIPDVIKVFNSDHTVYFCNKAGYKFYNKKPEEVEGKICYKLLNRNKRCRECCFNEVVKNKKMIKQERYIEELNKIMDVCYNPILDENGEVRFIIERLKDITEKKTLDKILKNDKERYKQIIDAAPDALMIIVDNKIELANNEALNLFQSENNDIINSNIYKYFNGIYEKIMHKKFRKILLEQKSNDLYDCELNIGNNEIISVQLSCSYILYEGNCAILMTLRNISATKRELVRAAKFQKNSLQKCFPGGDLFEATTVYVPAYIISGDFYRINKVNDELMVGILVDVKGKGISAALNISALELMFIEEISSEHEPIRIVENLNEKLANYYEENYIAVCCFSLDFSKKEMKIVGAGINQFMFQKHKKNIEKRIAEGSFLGMFADSEFIETTIPIKSGDRIFLFSDGFDFVFDEDNIIKRYMEKVSNYEFKKYIDEYLEDTILEEGNLKDDCTMIAIEIK